MKSLAVLSGVPGALVSFAAAASPYATSWSSFVPGTGGSATYADPAAALGSPTRFTGVQFGFPGAVTPFNPPFDPGEIVSIGKGGSLVLGFDHDVQNRASNPFGVDFIVFGNWFYADGGGFASGKFGARNATIEVSKNGSDWFLVPGANPTSGYATLGYSDLASPYETSPGSVPTDFTKAVDPSFDPIGKTYAEIVAGYNGSGGGTSVDFSATGLEFIRYVRLTNLSDSPGSLNIDAIAAVPGPTTITASLFVIATLIAPRRRRGC
jgi:hypothetical protein